MLRSSLPIATFAVLVIVTGVAHGLYTDRWHSSAAVENAVRRLDDVPVSVGNWRGEKDLMDAADLRRSGIQGHTMIRYRNIVTGKKVSMLIVCGRSGPISVHTPDICYATAGYEAAGSQFRKDVSMGKDGSLSVWALRFKPPATTAGASIIEVHWAWNAGDGWVAPDEARLSLSGYKALYKMYVVEDVSALPDPKLEDPAVSFLQTFLPVLEKVLSPKP